MRHQTRIFLCSAAAVAWLQIGSHRATATLADFADFQLGGVTASWDIFYGSNYLPVFQFQTGTAGNPIINSPEELTLRATVTTWQAGPPMPSNQQASGPIGSDSSVPGNREQFYTFFAGNINWDITGEASATLNSVVFQARILTGSNTSISNLAFNNISPTAMAFDSGTGVGTWQWTGLTLSSGDAYSFTWNTGTHTGFDAFQIQTGVVPEPTTWALLLIAGAAALARRRWTLLRR